MNAELARVVVVIDGDAATFKGIARIAGQAGFAAMTFPDCWSLAKWLNARAGGDPVASGAFCLVIDVRSLPPDAEWYASEHIRPIPKICVGTPAANSSTGQLMNSFQGEFVRKPFTLESIRVQIEAAFTRYANKVSEESEDRSAVGTFALLTNREHEVAVLVGRGCANLEIAGMLGITLKTVKAHRAKVMEKTQSGTIADFVRRYERYRQAARKIEEVSPVRADRNKEEV
ncbi:MAG: LuxR C-terminal-related transcriptional regulator [Sideroxyarcus sp.]|nr:LuxR C-terminal-related transcriptional regulator [Sideroxyarcus sp.]